tara:strand:- start:191 stop:406 length:216 start_codon:yes stop_codon:yes gene_type:complete
MALKVSGTTVIDDSKNIPSGTPSVQGTIVTATVLTAPSGTTAQRPASPNAGHIFFDTDEGKLVAYDGSDWV